MKRLIVSGAGGFLGSNIIKKALETGIEVVGITSKSDMYSEIEVVETDSFIHNGYLFKNGDIFINCFFPTNADGYKMAQGLEKLYSIISVAKECQVGAFINISSQSVYASKRIVPAKENDILCLETPYAVGKYSCEVYTNMFFKDTPHTNIRLANLVGVGYDQRIINRMISQALIGDKLNIVGGMQKYCFLDVRDAAEGIIKLAMSVPNKWKEVYNLGSNESYSLIDVVECIAEQIKAQTGNEISYIVLKGEDYRNSSLDTTSFIDDFYWHPKINLSKTAEDIISSKLVESKKD